MRKPMLATSRGYEPRASYPSRYASLPWPPENFLLLFTGFFMGEGCCSMTRSRPKDMGGNWAYHIRAQINLRKDDRAILDQASVYFGGKVRAVKDGRLVSWELTGLERVRRLMELMLEAVSDVPFKKVADMRLMLEYIEWRTSGPFRLSPEDRLVQDDYYHKLRAVKELGG